MGLIIDSFAGGGGASTGIEQALGRWVDIAINHDRDAIRMHKANHPHTKHYCEDVWQVDPMEATKGEPVDLFWLSPDCKHFSKAKGSTPVNKKIRGLAWIAVKWAKAVRPNVIMLENVEEFKTWGPVVDGRPDPVQKGKTFNLFLEALKRLGYEIDFRELKASDYGAPTSRKRFFMIARCDGNPIVWPAPTHGDPKSIAVRSGKLKPWIPAAEIIDWSIPCPSIFDRKKPLCENTLNRIARGIQKFIVDDPKPFLVSIGYGEREGQKPRVMDIDEPLNTVVSQSNKFALCTPFVAQAYGGGYDGAGRAVENPLPTITAVDHNYLIAPFISQIGQQNFGGDGRSKKMDEPLSTVVSKNEHLLITPFISQYHSYDDTARGQSLNDPLLTVDGSNRYAVIAPYMMHYYGTSVGASVKDPVGTITAKGQHIAQVEAFMIKYYGQGIGQKLDQPLDTVVSKDRFGLIMIYGEPYQIVDIGMRMLTPRELFDAQGFPHDYKIKYADDMIEFTKACQVSRCGNAVVPVLAKALVEANIRSQEQEVAL